MKHLRYLLVLLAMALPLAAGQLTINIGSSGNDGTGDPVRAAFGKINSNFTELYAADALLQPLDGDLTAISLLTTTSFGRGLLESANAAALRTAIGLAIGTDVLAPGGNGSALTGLVQAQVAGVTTSDRAQFSNVRITHSTLTYAGTTAIDFDGNGFQTCTLTGDVTFTSSNLAAGRSKTVRLVASGGARALAFPGGWVFIGAAAPTSLASGKTAILTLTSFGTADSDVVAAYAAQP